MVKVEVRFRMNVDRATTKKQRVWRLSSVKEQDITVEKKVTRKKMMKDTLDSKDKRPETIGKVTMLRKKGLKVQVGMTKYLQHPRLQQKVKQSIGN